jgi:hypothetical protein
MNRRVIQSKIPGTLLRKFSLSLHRSNGQIGAAGHSSPTQKTVVSS